METNKNNYGIKAEPVYGTQQSTTVKLKNDRIIGKQLR